MFIKQLKANLARMHKSFTIWFNGIVGIVIMVLPYAQANFPELQDYVDPALYKHAMGALIVGNLILRFKTNRALADK